MIPFFSVYRLCPGSHLNGGCGSRLVNGKCLRCGGSSVVHKPVAVSGQILIRNGKGIIGLLLKGDGGGMAVAAFVDFVDFPAIRILQILSVILHFNWVAGSVLCLYLYGNACGVKVMLLNGDGGLPVRLKLVFI